uniref:SP110 nuclear body protein, tandem duplicate 1 n=1 Tax=Lepisosteus oculatus TaxID=7918 RepID=W5N196_LEPOC
ELVLPVTCGGKQGRFDVGKYLEGQPCVLANRKWMSPREFEEHGGKGRNHKWKSSIRYKSRPLGALLEGDQPAKPVPKRKPTRSQSQSFQIKSTASPEVKRRKRSSSADSVRAAARSAEESPGEPGDLETNCSSFSAACHGRCIRTFRQWCTPLEFCRTGTPGADEGNWAQSIWHMGVPLANLIQLGILRPHPEDCSCVKCVPVVKKNKDKPDECKSCGQGRDLLCCDQCFRLFHSECHLPPLPGQADPQAEWICTLCEFSRTLVLLPGIHSRSEVLGLEMQSQQAKCVYLLLRLYCKQNSGPFTKNPSSIIKRPMWLDKVKEKLLQQKYQQVGQFVRDVRLIFQNCVQYNKVRTWEGLEFFFPEQ